MYSRRSRLSRRVPRSRKVPKSIKTMVRDGPPLYARTLRNIPDRIPDHTSNPRVTRIIRLYTFLNVTNPTIPVSYGTLGTQDSTDYSVAAFRYSNMRVTSVKCWLESPNNLSVSVTPPTLILTEGFSGYRTSDRGLAGSRYAKSGMDFSWTIQQSIVGTNSATVIFTVSTDITIPSSTNIPVTIDVVCEFV